MTSLSMTHVMTIAMSTNPSFSTVRHALWLSNHHCLPSRRATAREAMMPVTKSMKMKRVAQIISGAMGQIMAAVAEHSPLPYLNNVSIY